MAGKKKIRINLDELNVKAIVANTDKSSLSLALYDFEGTKGWDGKKSNSLSKSAKPKKRLFRKQAAYISR